MSLKQQKPHPQYPARSSDLSIPVYFTHPVVVKNIRTIENPNGWADPFWDTMTERQKISVVSRVPMVSDLEMRHFDYSENDSTYSGPLNPKGLTGMIGRGLLGRYGPNHAADPIVTRFNQDILEMAAIQRSDTGEWAIPGGMVENGETVSTTLLREFNEEALGNAVRGKHMNIKDIKSLDDLKCLNYIEYLNDVDYLNASQQSHLHLSPSHQLSLSYAAKINALQGHVRKLFSSGNPVYTGWVDDPRNTDWAWMETSVFHFHIEDDSPLHDIELRPATDATGAKWYKLDGPEALRRLYASHGEFILNAVRQKAAKKDPVWSRALLTMVL